jgi:hypothetical protein
VLRNVIQQFEKREDFKQQDEADRQQNKVIEETPDQVNVDQLRDACAALPPAERTAPGRRTIAGRVVPIGCSAVAGGFFPDGPGDDRSHHLAPLAVARHALKLGKKQYSKRGREQIGGPYADPDRQGTLARE